MNAKRPGRWLPGRGRPASLADLARYPLVADGIDAVLINIEQVSARIGPRADDEALTG